MLRNKDSAPIILATQSQARQKMLKNAGLKFKSMPAMLDETAIARSLPAGAAPQTIAMELAKKKALAVSAKNPSVLVIGSDQVLVLEGQPMGKAKNIEEAKAKLRKLRGQTHELVSAVAVAKEGTVLWTHQDRAALRMKNFSDEFLEMYCARAGEALTRAAGAYEYEGLGAWLFEKVEGDYFTILGMPLPPLLSYLYDAHGVRP